jgi:hypothetical protein
MMRFMIGSSQCCSFVLLLFMHVVVSSAEIDTPRLSFPTHQVIDGDRDEKSAVSSTSSVLALSLRDIVQRHLQQQEEEDSTATTEATSSSSTSTSSSSTSTLSSYSFLQLCHKISNLPNLECECTPLLEQWQEAQQERKELDVAYNVIFDKIELQKIKCESTNPVCSDSNYTSIINSDDDNDVTCGRFTVDVVTANANHDWSSSISQTTLRSCVMYTRMPTTVQLQPYRDGCVQWEYYTTTATTTMSSNSSSSSSSTNVLMQENCHVSFMNLETATMERCNSCQVCYTTTNGDHDEQKQRGINVDCDNVEPAASTTTANNNSTTSTTTSTTTCQVLDLDSFFPGFRPQQEYHLEQPPPPLQTTSSSSSPPTACISLFNVALLVCSIMVMWWYLVVAA